RSYRTDSNLGRRPLRPVFIDTVVGAEATSTSFRPPTVRMALCKAILMLATFAAWQEDQIEYQRHARLVHRRWWSGRRFPGACLVLGVPPVLLANEIDLRLPGTCDGWLVSSPSKWIIPPRAKVEGIGDDGPLPKKAFVGLAQPSADSEDGLVTSPFRKFVLMHALLERPMMVWQLCLDRHAQRLPPEDGARFELSLHRWARAVVQSPRVHLGRRVDGDVSARAGSHTVAFHP
ncbi:hypothetical protein CTA2_3983, partial [Colletotrichum tanaceti]